MKTVLNVITGESHCFHHGRDYSAMCIPFTGRPQYPYWSAVWQNSRPNCVILLGYFGQMGPGNRMASVIFKGGT